MELENIEILDDYENKQTLIDNLIAFFVKQEKMSPKKIQKLSYYTYAINYAIKDNENSHFNNIELEFEAWVHGPVNLMIYQNLKSYKYNIINIENSKYKTIEFENYFSGDELSYLNKIYSIFGKLNADQLEHLTHTELPWIEKRKGLGELENSQNQISSKTMKDFYRIKYDR